jgi:hypothetical protein
MTKNSSVRLRKLNVQIVVGSVLFILSFDLNRTTVRHSIHCKWCDYSDWWNEEQDEACEKEQK